MATPAPEEQRHWSLESLNKAYQQGYMAGLTEQTQQQPYAVDVLAAAWEAGWDDGHAQFVAHGQRRAG